MWRELTALVAWVLGCWWASPLYAGLYLPAEQEEAPAGPIVSGEKAGPLLFHQAQGDPDIGGPIGSGEKPNPLPFEHFRRDVLSELIGLAVPQPESPRRKHYLKKKAELQARAGTLTIDEQINLSAYMVRLGQAEEAAEVLALAARDPGQRNVMVFANLATANQLAGRPERALENLQDVKRAWPVAWPGLSRTQLDWYREAETYQLKLLRLRTLEMRRQTGGPAPLPEQVDNLFGPPDNPVHFVGELGKYEPGQLAASERAKLPGNALGMVQQLLVWLPQDTRLYWLYGELLNAQGNVPEAAAVLDECVRSRGWNADTLREHRRLLMAFQPKTPEPALEAPKPTTGDSPGNGQAGERSSRWQPTKLQLVLVGGFAGVVIFTLALLQVREIRRRRRLASRQGSRQGRGAGLA